MKKVTVVKEGKASKCGKMGIMDKMNRDDPKSQMVRITVFASLIMVVFQYAVASMAGALNTSTIGASIMSGIGYGGRVALITIIVLGMQNLHKYWADMLKARDMVKSELMVSGVMALNALLAVITLAWRHNLTVASFFVWIILGAAMPIMMGMEYFKFKKKVGAEKGKA